MVLITPSGIIKRVYFDVGSVVRAGQPLAELDSERTRLTLSQAQAQMNKLEANYRRAQQLVKDQMVSANDVDEIRFNLANARAQYQAARLELSYAVVTAPISGGLGYFSQGHHTLFAKFLVRDEFLESETNHLNES